MLARIEGDTVVEYREMEIEAVPEHKRALWRPVVIEGEGQVEVVSVEAERVLITRSPAPVSQERVIAERERRLSLGFDFDFGDGRGVHRIGTTEQDMKGWDEVTKASQAVIAVGQGSLPLSIVTDTGAVVVTALEWQMILLAAAQYRQPIWAASFALQAQSPIPADFADDSHWA